MSRRAYALAIGCAVVLGCAKAKPEATQSPMAETSVAAPEASDAGAPAPVTEAEPPADAEAPALSSEGEAQGAASLAQLRAELGGYEQRLRARGVRLHGKRGTEGPRKPSKKTPTKPAASKDLGGATSPTTTQTSGADDRCAEICELQTAICGLRDRICSMADDHEDAPEYADACERAEHDCERASEACDACP